jgi:hypothetical protein
MVNVGVAPVTGTSGEIGPHTAAGLTQAGLTRTELTRAELMQAGLTRAGLGGSRVVSAISGRLG